MSTIEKIAWCRILGLDAWKMHDRDDIGRAVRETLLRTHPDKTGAHTDIQLVLRARDAAFAWLSAEGEAVSMDVD